MKLDESVLPLLKQGKRLQRAKWAENKYLKLSNDEFVVVDDGKERFPTAEEILADDWRLHSEDVCLKRLETMNLKDITMWIKPELREKAAFTKCKNSFIITIYDEKSKIRRNAIYIDKDCVKFKFEGINQDTDYNLKELGL